MFGFGKGKGKKGKGEPDTADWLREPPATGGDSNPLAQRFSNSEETETEFFGQELEPTASAVSSTPPSDDCETRIFVTEEDAPANDPMANPPTGWLVVIGGPGRGSVVTVGYGMNNLGRGDNQRITLNFGDERLSRENHAMVTYDDKSNKFYVQHGGGPNLTYLSDAPLLTPQELSHGNIIKVGDTSLMFVPLCSNEFDWGMDQGHLI